MERDSNSDSDGLEWITGLNSVKQMYISQEYNIDNGYNSSAQVNDIDPDQLTTLKKKAKKTEHELHCRWEVYATLCVGPKRQKVPKEQTIGQSNQQYVDVCVLVKDPRT